MTYLQLIIGLGLLLGSGEFLVRGSVGFARSVGLSPLFIGLTLVGFGTSAPELVASLIAAFRDAPGIAVGNVVGSNIANVMLILGIASLIAPMPVSRQASCMRGRCALRRKLKYNSSCHSRGAASGRWRSNSSR